MLILLRIFTFLLLGTSTIFLLLPINVPTFHVLNLALYLYCVLMHELDPKHCCFNYTVNITTVGWVNSYIWLIKWIPHALSDCYRPHYPLEYLSYRNKIHLTCFPHANTSETQMFTLFFGLHRPFFKKYKYVSIIHISSLKIYLDKNVFVFYLIHLNNVWIILFYYPW